MSNSEQEVVDKQQEQLVQRINMVENRFDSCIQRLNKKGLVRVLKGFAHTPIGYVAEGVSKDERDLVQMLNYLLEIKLVINMNDRMKQYEESNGKVETSEHRISDELQEGGGTPLHQDSSTGTSDAQVG